MAKPTDSDCIATMATDCMGFRMRRLSRVVSAFYDEGLRPYRAKLSQINLMIIIAMHKRITPTELSRYAHMDVSTLSRNMERMIRSGWITSNPTEDGRSHLLSLTADGRAMLKKIYPAWEKAQEKASRLLGDRLIQNIRRIDNRLSKAP